MSNEKLEAFIARAGFRYGWRDLESWARRMAERAVKEQDALTARLAEAEALICELDAHEGAEGWSEDLNTRLLKFYEPVALSRIRIIGTTDSASACQHEWRPYAFHPNGGPASYYCPLCRVNRAPTATEIQESSVPDQPEDAGK